MKMGCGSKTRPFLSATILASVCLPRSSAFRAARIGRTSSSSVGAFASGTAAAPRRAFALGRGRFSSSPAFASLGGGAGAVPPSSGMRDEDGGGAAAAVSADPAAATEAAAAAAAGKPPVARREDFRVVLAGRLPPPAEGEEEEEKKPLLRQSESSTRDLLDPAVPVPDPYGWMRSDGRDDPEVMDHLRAENAYTENQTSHLAGLRECLYSELLRSIRETDYTVPARRGPYLYYTRTYEGKSYGASCRAPVPDDFDGGGEWRVEWDGSAEAPVLPGEEVYLDTNALAEGRDYCSTGQVRVSPGHGRVAYTVDFSGDETCELRVEDVATGEIVDHDEKLECDGTVVWGNDDSTLFYLKMDDAHRPYQVYRRRIGQAEAGAANANEEEDELLFQEDDELYWVRAWRSFDRRYLFVSTKSKETAEVHFLDLTDPDPDAKLRCVARRRPKVLYGVTHREGRWLVTTNVGGTPNMRLMTCPAVADSEALWEDAVDQDGNVMFAGGHDRSLDGVTPFASHLVASGREGGVPRVWVATFGSSKGEGKEGRSDDVVTDFVRLDFEEDAYDVGPSGNLEYDTDQVVLGYDSLVTPLRSIRVNMSNVSERTVLKEKEVPGYDRALFGCERTTAPSRDGTTQIPVSIVYRRDVMEKARSGQLSEDGIGGANVHLYGYGSYNACVEASFRSSRLPLLERGVIYAIAHVRGGGEMGRQWYEEPSGGKYLCKQNTFNDFVDVARWLIQDKKLTSPEKLSCEGRSAGGLLIGASVNQAPELFKAAILGVPFVDVVCTMIDASIPLTVAEWEEWGNPNEKKFFDYMMEYSPINNVKAGATYPSCLLTGGLHDPRVQYWEPAKFAAELRRTQGPESGPVCVKIDMSAGHFSASDRYRYLRELAFDYAFLLDRLGLASVAPKGE